MGAPPDHPVRRGGKRRLAALLAVLIAALLPGTMALPPIDRDESRFAQASAQMAASDDPADWAVPRIQDQPRLNKPPLIYWLQASCARFAGAGDWSLSAEATAAPNRDWLLTGGVGWYRLPSVLSAIVAAIGVWRLGRAMFPGVRAGPIDAGWLAGVMLGTCLLVMVDARQARADQLLLACTTLAMWALWGLYANRPHDAARRPLLNPVLFWLAIGAGVMAKGPITPMVAGLTTLALCLVSGRWRWLGRSRPLLGVAIVLGVAAPWVIAVGNTVGWTRYATIVIDETLGRVGSAAEGHWGPPGYHLVLLPILFWPGSLMTGAALLRMLRRRPDTDALAPSHAAPRRLASAGMRLRRRLARLPSAELFLVCWIAPAWIVFEMVTTKLPHYTLPLYPAIALLTAKHVVSWTRLARVRAVRPPLGAAWAWTAVGGALLAMGVAAVVYLEPREFGGTTAQSMMSAVARWLAGGLGAGAVLAFAARALLQGRLLLGHLLGAGAAALTSMVLLAMLAPSLDRPWVSPRLGGVIAREDPAGVLPIALVDYREDSMIFLTRGRAERVGRRHLPEWLAAHPSALLVLDADRTEPPPGAREVGGVDGLNYAKGRNVSLTVWRTSP